MKSRPGFTGRISRREEGRHGIKKEDCSDKPGSGGGVTYSGSGRTRKGENDTCLSDEAVFEGMGEAEERRGREMRFVILKKPVTGLPYPVGAVVPITYGRFNLPIWHVGLTLITLPKGTYRLIRKDKVTMKEGYFVEK